jgi:branched-chain amino acid transport system ATP-binding protein
VLVEQNLEFIAELAKRVLLIQKGTILRELQPGELRHADVLSEFVGVDRA